MSEIIINKGMHRYTKQFSVDELLPQLFTFSKKDKYVVIDGFKIKSNSDRYYLFRKSQKCVVCGCEGTYMHIEKDKVNETWHVNLYGLDKEGNEVLFTKDHIVPKSKGGKDNQSNYQVMCFTCNNEKKNSLKDVSLDQINEKTTRMEIYNKKVKK